MRVLLVFLLSGWLSTVSAHKASDSYLNLQAQDSRIAVQWDIALRDLEFAIGIDGDGDGAIRWGEIRAREKDLTAYALAHLGLQSAGVSCAPGAVELLVEEHTDGGYVVLRYQADCAHPVESFAVDYRLFATLDPQHRGLVQAKAGETTTSAVLGPDHPTQSITFERGSGWTVWKQYVVEGVWHILIGYDHILFLLSLLLPTVAWRARDTWQIVSSWRPAGIEILKTVTAFTLAHSVTLALAALGLVNLPSRPIESAIAASVVYAAVENLRGTASRRWKIAFGFGLIHGFGFASVLRDLGLPADALAVALFGFNAGVELGQLAVVALFLPVAYALRSSAFYRHVIYQTGSVVIALVALGWFIERAAAISLF